MPSLWGDLQGRAVSLRVRDQALLWWALLRFKRANQRGGCLVVLMSIALHVVCRVCGNGFFQHLDPLRKTTSTCAKISCMCSHVCLGACTGVRARFFGFEEVFCLSCAPRCVCFVPSYKWALILGLEGGGVPEA